MLLMYCYVSLLKKNIYIFFPYLSCILLIKKKNFFNIFKKMNLIKIFFNFFIG